MKYETRRTFANRVESGLIYANEPPVTFAGVPSNFKLPSSQNSSIPGNPGNSDVPSPAPVPPAQQSRMVPGQPSSSSNKDQLAPAPQGQSPLDRYAPFFNNSQSSQQKSTTAPKPNAWDATPDQFVELANKQDFSTLATPEQRANMAKGGEEGVAAMMEVINTVGRNLYAQTGALAAGMTRKSLEVARNSMTSDVDARTVFNSAAQAVIKENPVLDNQIYRPIVTSVMNHFQKAEPGITSERLADLTLGYIRDMNSTTTQTSTPAQPSEGGLEDFFKF